MMTKEELLIRLHNELRAAGIVFTGVSYDGTISDLQPGQESLAALIVAARDKPLSSPECQAVKAALGDGSSAWLAYKAVRQKIIEHARLEEYQTQVLQLLVGLFENATYIAQSGGQVPAFNTAQLLAARDKITAIRAAHPDEV